MARPYARSHLNHQQPSLKAQEFPKPVTSLQMQDNCLHQVEKATGKLEKATSNLEKAVTGFPLAS